MKATSSVFNVAPAPSACSGFRLPLIAPCAIAVPAPPQERVQRSQRCCWPLQQLRDQVPAPSEARRARDEGATRARAFPAPVSVAEERSRFVSTPKSLPPPAQSQIAEIGESGSARRIAVGLPVPFFPCAECAGPCSSLPCPIPLRSSLTLSSSSAAAAKRGEGRGWIRESCCVYGREAGRARAGSPGARRVSMFA